MSNFTFHDEKSAPADSAPLLKTAKSAYGFVPNLLAGMSTSPQLTEGYMTLSSIFNKTDLSETERQIILMTNNRLNGCNYCMAAHTTISQGANVDADVIEALRTGSPIADPKLEALRIFSAQVNEKRGWVGEKEVAALLAAGYTQETVLNVVLGTSLKVMSNYTNHITETPVDEAFKPNTWTA